jgi:hypothetical protein
MSDDYTIWIPLDPSFVPDEAAAQRAVEWLSARAPRAHEVNVEISPEIRFVDCGANFSSVRCHLCGSELETDWWQEAMDRAASTAFKDRVVDLPCCGARAGLEMLHCEWPQGFARFALQALNADIGEPTPKDDETVARLLGTPVRRIHAHYRRQPERSGCPYGDVTMYIGTSPQLLRRVGEHVHVEPPADANNPVIGRVAPDLLDGAKHRPRASGCSERPHRARS